MSTGSNSPDEPTGELPRRDPDATSGIQPKIEPARESRAEAAEVAETTGRSGDTIGPFRLIEMIGEGGFGEVWLAERREPMVQRVALKIIKPGMDSKAVVARFEQERQALAVMDHPNVARVFDGGVTATGRPYFVMEFVDGEPLTEFADRKKLSLRQRLELFIPICEAVQHAHHKGLVHRDLKPGNVLVAEIEGKPVPKVIDFGIAKAIASEGWTNTAHTQSGVVIGTPLYMSPEQVAGEVDVDTRADVYSLGVMLYELLAGEVPFDPAMLRKAALAEIQRVIREVTPPKPSTRIAQASGARTTAIAEARSASRERIAGELRRELDWIPLMALRKERERRYESPQALADDLRRYLDGRPLRAAPESRAYLARKFVRRNKVQVAALAAVFVALAAGLAVALWQRNEAIAAKRAETEQRARADERAVAAEKAEAAATAARDAEKQRADELKRVSDFQSQMLSSIDTTQAGVRLMDEVRTRFTQAAEKAGVPEQERAAQAETLAKLLERVNATDLAVDMIDGTIIKPALKTIDERFKDDPKIDASLRQALADLYWNLGLNQVSFPLQESALETRRRVLGEDHPDTLLSLNHMGVLLKDEGRLREAEPYLREAVEKRKRVLGEEHPDTGSSINSLAHLLDELDRLPEAEPLYREAMRIFTKVYGEDDEDTIITTSNLSILLRATDRLDEAEKLTVDTLARSRRALGEDHRITLILISSAGQVLQKKGKHAEAEPYLREAFEKSRRTLGEDHPRTLVMSVNLGMLLNRLGKSDDASRLLEEAIANMRRVLGDEHPTTTRSIGNLARVRMSQGRHAEAEPLLLEAYEKQLRVLGDAHPSILKAMGDIVDLYTAWEKAEPGKAYQAKAGEWQARLDAAAKAMGATKVE